MRLLSGVPDSSPALSSGVLGFASAAFARLGFSRVSFGLANPSTMRAPACKAAASSSTAADAGAGAQKPWLFVGLGNPGRMYKGTRHNVGFEIIDAIAEAEGISISSKQFKALVGKGGHGGHNGMRSIIDHLKSRNFPRLRIGIGRPPEELGAISFVLQSFITQEKEELEVTFQKGLQAVRIMVHEGFNKSATFVNTPQPSSEEMLNR